MVPGKASKGAARVTRPPKFSSARPELLERFARLKPIVEGMAYNIRPADEDMLQTGLCSLWEMVVRGEYQDNAWIVTAVRHDMIDRIRYQRLREKAERLIESSHQAQPDTEEKLRQVLDLLSVLPAALRRPFQLHVVDELTVAETADRLSLSTRTVYRRIALARRLLQKELE